MTTGYATCVTCSFQYATVILRAAKPSKASSENTAVSLMAHIQRIATRFWSRSMFRATSVAI